MLVSDWGGRFPRNPDDIARLPGIGRSTAAAIAAFAFGHRSPIMDGNVKRVFTRYFGIYGVTTLRAVETVLWRTAQDALAAAPQSLDMTAYTQGLMDLGATRCTRSRPACFECPLSAACYARIEAVQHELPTPRPRKTIPRRECKMLVLDHDAHILLERQASPGIWGGLWSLPRFDDAGALETALTNWGQNAQSAQKMARLLHVFSHFSLEIEPWRLHCAGPIAAQPSPHQAWVAIPHLPRTALPAPVRKILEGLYPRSGL
jgi:A/G-specific adenine glycosylase